MKTGNNALFIPGPTNMPFRVRQAMDVALEDMRAPDFPEFTLPLLADLKKVFKTETGQVFVFPASGTGGWESAIANTLSPGDKVLLSVFGPVLPSLGRHVPPLGSRRGRGRGALGRGRPRRRSSARSSPPTPRMRSRPCSPARTRRQRA